MYADRNFATKKALREAVAAGEYVGIMSPGPFPAPTEGQATVEGPWYPRPHRWYACVRVQAGRIISVK